ncbi:MAG: hypothetical protein RLN96_08430 [Pseudomonadales bacterium]
MDVHMDRVELAFTDPGAIRARDLSSYLHYFTAAYAIAVEHYGNVPPERLLEKFGYYLDDFRRMLCQLGNNEKLDMVEYFFYAPVDKHELYVQQIQTNTALRLFCYGSEVGILLPAMVSGCEFGGTTEGLDMEPLPAGLKRLKEAFFKLPGREK